MGEDLDYGKSVLQAESDAILLVMARLDSAFERAVDLLAACPGHVVVTGMGKPGLIGQKISATLASTGTPSFSLHPAEAIHGDLGRVVKDDVVLALSNSGESEEVVRLIPPIKRVGARILCITGNPASSLATQSDVAINMGPIQEACPLGLAPSASTTAMLAVGDALALAVQRRRGFDAERYAFYHPGGSLGRSLLRVRELMRTGERNPLVRESATVKEVLKAITAARAGAIIVVEANGLLAGIFTDGDLRRLFDRVGDLSGIAVSEVMTRRPVTIGPDRLASEAARVLQERKIDELPVVDDEGRPLGMLDVQDLLSAGIV